MNGPIASPRIPRACSTGERPPASAVALLLMAGAVWGLAASGAVAQIQDGRALDRNPAVYGDGRNPRGTDYDAIRRFNDSVISGTAANGKSFRGNTGYRAPGEFGGGGVAGSTQYGFRRDAASSGLAGTGIRSSDILSWQFSASTGQARDELNPTIVSALSPARPGVAASGTTLKNLRSVADFQAAEARKPSPLSFIMDRSSGNLAMVEISTLRGLTSTPVPSAELRPRRVDSLLNPSARTNVPGGAGGSTPAPGSTPATSAAVGSARANTPLVRSGFETAAGTVSTFTARAAAAKTPAGRPATPAGSGPGAAGATPGTRPETAPTATPGRSPSEEIDRFRSLMTSGVDPFAGPPTPLSGGGPAPTPRDVRPGQLPAPGGRADWRNELLGSVGTDAKLQTELTRMGVVITRPKPVAPDATPPRPVPGDQRPSVLPTDSVIIDALREAAKADTVVRELVPADAPPDLEYTILMRRGQRELASGANFDAESTFDRAMKVRGLTGATGGPGGLAMAQAGRMHAQLAAGLLVSGSNSIRDLLISNPELVPVRFDASILPPRARMDQVVARVRGEVAKGGEGGLAIDGQWVLAYAGWQYRERAWLEEGLAGLDARAGRLNAAELRLLELLRTVWLDKPSPAPAPAPAAAPAVPLQPIEAVK